MTALYEKGHIQMLQLELFNCIIHIPEEENNWNVTRAFGTARDFTILVELQSSSRANSNTHVVCIVCSLRPMKGVTITLSRPVPII